MRTAKASEEVQPYSEKRRPRHSICMPIGVYLSRFDRKRKITKNWQLYLLLILPLVYFLLFYYVPIYGVQIAFKNFTASKGIWGSPWVGFKHFEKFFSSYYFGITIKNTLGITVVNLLWGFPLSIILALSINEIRSRFLKKSMQTITYAPYFLALTVVISMLTSFLNPNYGIINRLITFLGGKAEYWITMPKAFRAIFVASDIWQTMGWGSIVYLAALSGVDVQLYEAADIDGATKLQKIIHINLPTILPTIITLFILQAGKMMNVGFEKIFLMQNDLNIDASEVISTYIYRKGILGCQYSFSSAVGLINSGINFFLVMMVNGISRRVTNIGLW